MSLRVRGFMGIAILGGVLTAAVLFRWVRRDARATRDAAEGREAFEVTGAHLSVLRTAVIAWQPEESGGPYIARFTAPWYQTARLTEEDLLRAFEILLEFGTLEPGEYMYENPYGGAKAASWQADANTRDMIPIPTTAQVVFHMTSDHLRLLHAANARETYVGIGIDGKRPYGDMTCFFLDMGQLLAVPAKPAAKSCEESFANLELRRFEELHRSMAFALQAYLAHATLAPGRFTRTHVGYGPWRREAWE